MNLQFKDTAFYLMKYKKYSSNCQQ